MKKKKKSLVYNGWDMEEIIAVELQLHIRLGIALD